MRLRWIIGALLLQLIVASAAIAAPPIDAAIPITGMT
jgi:hypothetical protein